MRAWERAILHYIYSTYIYTCVFVCVSIKKGRTKLIIRAERSRRYFVRGAWRIKLIIDKRTFKSATIDFPEQRSIFEFFTNSIVARFKIERALRFLIFLFSYIHENFAVALSLSLSFARTYLTPSPSSQKKKARCERSRRECSTIIFKFHFCTQNTNYLCWKMHILLVVRVHIIILII